MGPHQPSTQRLQIGTPELFAAQTREPFPNAAIGNSPAVKAGYSFRYGLGAWLECATPAAGCTCISSPGAFGFTPWLDREAGYYAIIATELANTRGGVVKDSLDLEQALKPAFAAALR